MSDTGRRLVDVLTMATSHREDVFPLRPFWLHELVAAQACDRRAAERGGTLT